MNQQVTPASYTGEIIVESISNPGILDAMRDCLVHERIENMPAEEEPVWHVRKYHVPTTQLDDTIQMLERAIKPGWYIHFFNLADKALYVILHGKTFKLSLQKDESWKPMIAYGLTVGVERKWTENIRVDRV